MGAWWRGGWEVFAYEQWVAGSAAGGASRQEGCGLAVAGQHRLHLACCRALTLIIPPACPPACLPAVVGNAQPELVQWVLEQPQEERLVVTDAPMARGILEGLARHGLY